VSFVDYARPVRPRYRHVLLVEPYRDRAGNPSFRAVPVHAGGIAWYGHYLYVADTYAGFRVFDTRHRGVLPPGPEDLAVWRSRDQLWTLAEHPGRRSVLAVRASAL
jgi:hypothetical protein